MLQHYLHRIALFKSPMIELLHMSEIVIMLNPEQMAAIFSIIKLFWKKPTKLAYF